MYQMKQRSKWKGTTKFHRIDDKMQESETSWNSASYQLSLSAIPSLVNKIFNYCFKLHLSLKAD